MMKRGEYKRPAFLFTNTTRRSNGETAARVKRRLTRDAVRAALQLRFTPAILNDQRISQYIVLENNFNIY